MLRKAKFLSWFVIMGIIENSSTDDAGVTFTFKEYQYKDSPKNVYICFVYLSNKAKLSLLRK